MSADSDMVERAKAAIDAATLGAIKPYLDAAARAALDASGIGELVEGDLDELRFVLNCSESNTRISTVMRTFTLPDRVTTKEKLERLYAALSRARATVETNSE